MKIVATVVVLLTVSAVQAAPPAPGEAPPAAAEPAPADDASDAATLLAQARAAHAEEQNEAALQSLDRLLAEEPGHQEARRLRGDIYFALGELDKAMADYGELQSENASAAVPAPIPAPSNLGDTTANDLLWQSVSETAAGRFDRALALCNQVLAMNVSSYLAAAACLARGNVYRLQGNLAEALQDYEQAIRLHPANGLAYMYRGLILASRGEHEAAIKDLSEAIGFDPTMYLALYNRAGSYMVLGLRKAARRDLDKAIRIHPKYALAYLRKGALLLQEGAMPEAQKAWQTAARLDPTLPEPWFALATLDLRKRRFQAAVGNLEKAAALQGAGSLEALNSLAWLHATCPEEAIRNGKKAVAEATRACELSHWVHPSIIDTLAASYAEGGEFQKAADFQWYALSLMPPESDARPGAEQRLQLYQQGRAYRDTEAPQTGKEQRPTASPTPGKRLKPPPSRAPVAGARTS